MDNSKEFSNLINLQKQVILMKRYSLANYIKNKIPKIKLEYNMSIKQ